MLDEVLPTCDPFGAENKLIFAPGLLVGHRLSSCDRISVGGKSPLTGGIKESNAGGSTGYELSCLGVKALIIEDLPRNDRWWLLRLDRSGARFEPADEIKSLGVYQTAENLIGRFGEQVAIALIGPGGEMGLTAAGIQNLDKDRVPSRIAARGGLGAVMGSKRLKAIVIDATETNQPPLSDPAGFQQARKAYNKALMKHPQTTSYRDYGTAGMTMLCNTVGALPTRNFTQGQFEDAERLSGDALREALLSRGGACDPSHPCMVGCAIQSSNVYGGEDGRPIVSPLEYETISLMGSNLGINDLDAIACMNYQVNDLGLDSIDVGAALGIAASTGRMEFGDGQKALELIAEIRAGTDFGRALGSGAVATGKALGVQRIPAVKGQALSAYDPRAVKGTGVTYATSPQGADHTCGLTIRAKIDHLSPEGQVEVSRNSQFNVAGYDSLGVCTFASFGFSLDPGLIPELIRARYGWDVSGDYLAQLGRESLCYEREFNRLAGFTPADDRLPEWLGQEALPPHDTVFDVPDDELDAIFADLETPQ
jgi:aldehyde:ferredoxin oxidoreductase